MSGVAYENLGEASPRAALGFAAGALVCGGWFLWETRDVLPRRLHRLLLLALVGMNLLIAVGAVQQLFFPGRDGSAGFGSAAVGTTHGTLG